MSFPESLQTLAELLKWIKNTDIERVIEDLFTPSEIVELGERIALLKQLKAGKTQREIASDLGMSVTTVSRGARVLKYGKGIVAKYL